MRGHHKVFGCLALIVVLLVAGIVGIVYLYDGERVLAGETEPVKCVGLAETENRVRVPGVAYRVAVGNVVVGVILIETIVAPVYIALTSVYCPVSRTSATP